ncbi:MAG: GDP-mannose 4,6-dehydratase [Fimbriimonadaceae bacterium]|nr:GDP-mannose 4,6-dehydratase [Fimbriimonadaceae bacterium]
MDDRRIAVIGSNSFSGGDLIDLLLDDPANDVLGCSRSPEKGPLFLRYRQRASPRYRFLQADLNHDLPALLAALAEFQPQYVVNFAAQSEVAPSWQHPEQWFQTNCVALAALGNWLKDQPWLRRYLQISSPEVYGTCQGTVAEDAPLRPSTPYAASKAAADLFLSTLRAHWDFPLVTVRATNVYGAHQQLFKIIPRTCIYLRLGQTIELHGGGQAVKSWIHVRDVSRGELAALFDGQLGAIYHLSPDDQGHAVAAVVQRLCERSGRDFTACTRAVGERLGQDAAYVIDSTRARQELGWRPQIGLDEGLDEVLQWVAAYWDEIAQQPLQYVHQP